MMSAPNPRASDRALDGSGIGPERVRAPPCVAMRPPILEPGKLRSRPVRQILNYPRTCESPHRRSWSCRSGYLPRGVGGLVDCIFSCFGVCFVVVLCVLAWLAASCLICLCRVVFVFAVCLLAATVVAAVAWLSVASSVRRLRLLCVGRLPCCSCDALVLSSFVCCRCGRGPIGLRP